MNTNEKAKKAFFITDMIKVTQAMINEDDNLTNADALELNKCELIPKYDSFKLPNS